MGESEFLDSTGRPYLGLGAGDKRLSLSRVRNPEVTVVRSTLCVASTELPTSKNSRRKINLELDSAV